MPPALVQRAPWGPPLPAAEKRPRDAEVNGTKGQEAGPALAGERDEPAVGPLVTVAREAAVSTASGEAFGVCSVRMSPMRTADPGVKTLATLS